MDLQVKGTRERQNHSFCLDRTTQIPVVTPFIVPAVVYKLNQPRLLAIMQFPLYVGKKEIFSSHPKTQSRGLCSMQDPWVNMALAHAVRTTDPGVFISRPHDVFKANPFFLSSLPVERSW